MQIHQRMCLLSLCEFR